MEYQTCIRQGVKIMSQLTTLQELYPSATKEQIQRNQKALIKNALDNDYGDDKRYDDAEPPAPSEEDIDQEQYEFEQSVEADKKDRY